uniref:Uncharacterized protein n=1 Tax=Chrysotila carterae TaxID=13221 RepID=A0A7S4EZF4_CHRCT|eukprot:1562421-Pleurochrysis_carterae.AAC.9
MSASLCMRVRGCVDARVRMRVRANACACAKACASALNRARACVRPLAVRAFIIASLSSLSTVWSARARNAEGEAGYTCESRPSELRRSGCTADHEQHGDYTVHSFANLPQCVFTPDLWIIGDRR